MRAIEAQVHDVLAGDKQDANWQNRGDARVRAFGGMRDEQAIEELLSLWTKGTGGSNRSTGSLRGSDASNPFEGAIVASLNELTGQSLNDQKAYHEWCKANEGHFGFER